MLLFTAYPYTPINPYTPIKSSFEDAGSVENMMLYRDRIAKSGSIKSRIERFMGYATKTEMLRIDMALLVSLALNVLTGSRSE